MDKWLGTEAPPRCPRGDISMTRMLARTDRVEFRQNADLYRKTDRSDV